MSPHVVYRIQDKKGRGPYRSGLTDFMSGDSDPEGDYGGARPGPSNDNISCSSYDYFGFSSIDQLRQWFKTRRHQIPRQHSRIVIVYAMRVQYGRHQVCYDKRSVISHA